jgi:serine/threonine protein kinase
LREKDNAIHRYTKLPEIINWLKLQFLGESKETGPIDTQFFSDLSDIRTVGRYEIVGRLGKGSMGVVYLGRDPYIDRKVSIKISGPSSDDLAEPADKYRERFFLEAQSA